MPINNSTSTRIFRWRPACWLRVTGDDAAGFLQGQFTNDLRALPQAGAVYGLWLSLKGKVLADSFILRREAAQEFWIGSYFSPASVIRERIESHVIADDVTVEDLTERWAGISVVGEASMSFPTESAATFAFQGRRGRGLSREYVFLLTDGEPGWVADAGAAALASEEEMVRWRIKAGIPAIPTEVGPADLPNEAGLEVDAISYTKGCYLGQEVMARLKSMGQVRRRLVRVGGMGETWPTLPAPLFAGTRAVSELRSAVRDAAGGWIGLAMVTRMHVTAGAELSLAPDAAPVVRLLDVP